MRNTAIALFGLVTMILFSCATTREMKVEVCKIEHDDMARNILTGAGYEGIEKGLVVCNTQAELDTLKNRMNKVNYSTKQIDEYTIDWQNETVLAYFTDVLPSGGYIINADSLMKHNINGDLFYEMHYTLQIPKGNVATMMTQPYFFSKAAKLDGPVKAVLTEQQFAVPEPK